VNKIAHYLQQHISGEVLTSSDVLDYFSTDESIIQIRPELVVYPRSDKDIRKVARFTWQLSEKGRAVTMTARGMGTDQTGAALGNGIMIAMPAHMNRIIELDPKSGVVTAEAGMTLDKLQQVLNTHGRFLPPASAVNGYATVGGAVANNDSGRSSYKYGPMQEYVRGLRIVLANGELIETGRLTKRELNKKLGLASFEGEIYRSLDKLIEDSHETIEPLKKMADHSKAGYNISDVKQKDGSFDLTPLFLGSQGTLGIITEAILDTAPYNPVSTFFVAGFAERSQAWNVVAEINKLKEGPSSLDFADESLLRMVQDINPGVLKPLEGGMPATLLFFEIDNDGARSRKKIQKKIFKIIEESGAQIVEPSDDEREEWDRLRDAASVYLTHRRDKKQALPFIDDAQVPIERMTEFFNELEGLMQASGIEEYAAWGQAGNGLIHVSPLLDISSVGDRQRLFKIMEAYYGYICQIGGSITAEYAEGRLRGQFTDKQFDPDAIELFRKIKSIFDPTKTLNTGVKFDTDMSDLKSMIRDEYSLDHQYNHLPRS
jgi:FAD/FMN-containing dehydrogenase